jgi:hypothetical protein
MERMFAVAIRDGKNGRRFPVIEATSALPSGMQTNDGRAGGSAVRTLPLISLTFPLFRQPYVCSYGFRMASSPDAFRALLVRLERSSAVRPVSVGKRGPGGASIEPPCGRSL